MKSHQIVAVTLMLVCGFPAIGAEEQSQATAAMEAAGMAAIQQLSFMQQESLRPFSCHAPAISWDGAELTKGMQFFREYQSFIAARSLDAASDTPPHYVVVLRQRLHAALDDSLERAQVKIAERGLRADVAYGEQVIAQQSTNLAQVNPTLIKILAVYRQLDFATQRDAANCMNTFSQAALESIYNLSQATNLYRIPASQYPEAGQPLFALGGAGSITAFLERELQRAQVMANYSEPFIQLLLDLSGKPPTTKVSRLKYWQSTLRELERGTQRSDPKAQSMLLAAFIRNQAGELTRDNCEQKLKTYDPPVHGSDFFSNRRKAWEREARRRCDRT